MDTGKNSTKIKGREKKFGNFNDKNNKYVKMVPYLDYFIDTYSESTQPHVFNKLVNFTLYCKEKYEKEILDVSSPEVLSYFQKVINKMNIKKATKIKYRHVLNSYYNYVKNFKEQMEQEKFENPVPSSIIWDFSGTTSSLEDIEIEDELLTMEVVERIFEYLYYVPESLRIFIIMSLILYSGARGSEVLHIELKNIDLKNRWFVTRIKSRKSEKRDGIYFFPPFFVPELKKYVKKLKYKKLNAKYLFQQGTSHLSIKTLDKHMRKVKKALGLKCATNPHAFRDFINTLRIEMRIPKEIRKILLNQKAKDINITYYAKKFKNRVHLRELYDKCTPFKKLIKPNPTL